MNYQQTKTLYFKCFPSIYYDEMVFLRRCFFVIGTGYVWKNGEIINVYDNHLKPETVIKKIRKERKGKYLKTGISNWNYKKQQKYWKNYYSNDRMEFDICDLSNIFEIPDDIKPDWLDAAKIAIKLAKTEQMGKLTKESRELIKLAEQKLETISGLRNDNIQQTSI